MRKIMFTTFFMVFSIVSLNVNAMENKWKVDFYQDNHGRSIPISFSIYDNPDESDDLPLDNIVSEKAADFYPQVKVEDCEKEACYKGAVVSDNMEHFGLSIDGGGIRGLMPSIWLEYIEKKIQNEFRNDAKIYEVFDCIGGTSIGGILALGLAKGISAQDLCLLFRKKNNRENIFYVPQQPYYLPKFVVDFWGSYFKPLISVKFESHSLKELLVDQFENSLLKDSKTDVLVTACSTDGYPFLFNNYYAPYKELRMWDVALCTSAAPTYFESHELLIEGIGSKRFVDGGIWANNPSPFVASHLMKKFQAQRNNVHVLSLGTGISLKRGWIPDAATLTSVASIIDALMISHTNGNHIMMKHFFEDSYFRIDALLEEAIDLADISDYAIGSLTEKAELEKKMIDEYFDINRDRISKKLGTL